MSGVPNHPESQRDTENRKRERERARNKREQETSRTTPRRSN